jgi:hypothetical protein
LIVSMSQKMYDSRDFADMPVMADALEDAGCQEQDILRHCRQQGSVGLRPRRARLRFTRQRHGNESAVEEQVQARVVVEIDPARW